MKKAVIVYRQNRASAIQCDTAADLAGSVYIPARHAQICTDTAHVLTNSLIFPLYLVMYYCNHVSVAFCQLCFTRINEKMKWKNCAHVSSGLSSVSALNNHSQSHHTVFCYLVHASVCACTRISNPGFPVFQLTWTSSSPQNPSLGWSKTAVYGGHKTALPLVKLRELGIFSAIWCTFCTIRCRSV